MYMKIPKLLKNKIFIHAMVLINLNKVGITGQRHRASSGFLANQSP